MSSSQTKPASTDFPHLFNEGKMGSLTLRNRIVMPAMETNFASLDGEVTDRLINYYVRRGEGGVGLIIIEGACIEQEGKGFPKDIAIDDDRFIPGLRRLADAVKQSGARIAVQLLHAGRQTSSAVTGSPLLAPSPIPWFKKLETPEALTVEQISRIVDRYAAAARRAKEAGFDAVEVHGAHGYLIHQFLSPLANQREDQYGGSKENRVRFAREVLAGVRSQVGDDYPVLLRMSAKEFIDGGIELPDATWYCRELSPYVQALNISAGAYGADDWITQPYSNEPGQLAPMAGHIRKTVDVPVITVGRIHTPELAEEVIATGEADFVAIGRGLIADPDFPLKAENGRVEEIWQCLSCNVGCVDRITLKQDIGCMINPYVGRDGEQPVKMEKPVSSLVVGGGPAGLSVALALAERGGKVTIAERNQLGGQFSLAAKVPHKAHFERLIEHYTRRLESSGVEFHHASADLDFIRKINPGHVFIATGSRPGTLPIPGLETIKSMTYVEALEKGVKENSVAIIGAGATGCELAELLLMQGKQVTLIELQNGIAAELVSMRKPLRDRLRGLGPEIHTGTRVLEIDGDQLILENNGETFTKSGIQCLVFACGVRPELTLAEELAQAGINHTLIGDCNAPRNAFWAFREGFEAAMQIVGHSD